MKSSTIVDKALCFDSNFNIIKCVEEYPLMLSGVARGNEHHLRSVTRLSASAAFEFFSKKTQIKMCVL